MNRDTLHSQALVKQQLNEQRHTSQSGTEVREEAILEVKAVVEEEVVSTMITVPTVGEIMTREQPAQPRVRSVGVVANQTILSGFVAHRRKPTYKKSAQMNLRLSI